MKNLLCLFLYFAALFLKAAESSFREVADLKNQVENQIEQKEPGSRTATTLGRTEKKNQAHGISYAERIARMLQNLGISFTARGGAEYSYK